MFMNNQCRSRGEFHRHAGDLYSKISDFCCGYKYRYTFHISGLGEVTISLGTAMQTMNVHQLRHLLFNVRNWLPLWSLLMFRVRKWSWWNQEVISWDKRHVNVLFLNPTFIFSLPSFFLFSVNYVFLCKHKKLTATVHCNEVLDDTTLVVTKTYSVTISRVNSVVLKRIVYSITHLKSPKFNCCHRFEFTQWLPIKCPS